MKLKSLAILVILAAFVFQSSEAQIKIPNKIKVPTKVKLPKTKKTSTSSSSKSSTATKEPSDLKNLKIKLKLYEERIAAAKSGESTTAFNDIYEESGRFRFSIIPTYIKRLNEKYPSYDISKEIQLFETYKKQGAKLYAENEKKKEEYFSSISNNIQLDGLTDKLGNLWFESQNAEDDVKALAADFDKVDFSKIRTKSIADPASDEAQSLKKLETYFTSSKYTTLVNSYIDRAYKLKSRKNNFPMLMQAKGVANAAVVVSGIGAKAFPSNSAIVQKHTGAKSSAAAISKDLSTYFASAHTSDFHKQNAEQIVLFSNFQPIKNENKAEIKDVFNAGDYISGRVYLNGALNKYDISGNNAVKVQLFADGNRISLSSENYVEFINASTSNKTYIDFQLVPNPSTYKVDYTSGTNAENLKIPLTNRSDIPKGLSVLSPRTHEMKLIIDISSDVKFTKIFTINATEAGLKKWASIGAQIEEKHLESVRLPKASMTNAGIEAAMMKIPNAWEDEEGIKAIITGNWKTNYFGTSRSIAGVVVTKIKSSGACVFHDIAIQQAITNAGYGEYTYGGISGTTKIACKNAR